LLFKIQSDEEIESHVLTQCWNIDTTKNYNSTKIKSKLIYPLGT